MADFEIRVGATPDDIIRRTIGISPPLPQNIIDRIHDDPDGCGLPYIRFGRITPSESSAYSEATIWCNGQTEKWNDNEAFKIALAVKGLLRFAASGGNVLISEQVDRTLSKTRFLFGNPEDVEEPKNYFLRVVN